MRRGWKDWEFLICKREDWGVVVVFIQVTAAAGEGNKLLSMSAGEMGGKQGMRGTR